VNLAEFAAAVRELAGRCEESLARDCAAAGARAFLPILRSTTPVESGRLRESEAVKAVTGGGTHAEAVIAPNTVYALFRENGGTIHVRRAKVLTDGVSFFGRSVTQAGSHYVQRAHDMAEGPVQVAVQMVVDKYFEESGL
jgi:Bacteriophage HK97-gp10, putative tail-component